MAGVCRPPGDGCALAVDPSRLVRQVILAQHQRGCAERIGLYDVRASIQVFQVDVLDHVRARYVQVLVTAFVLRPPEILRSQTPRLDLCSHGAVRNQDAPAKQRFQLVDAF